MNCWTTRGYLKDDKQEVSSCVCDLSAFIAADSDSLVHVIYYSVDDNETETGNGLVRKGDIVWTDINKVM